MDVGEETGATVLGQELKVIVCTANLRITWKPEEGHKDGDRRLDGQQIEQRRDEVRQKPR